MNLNRFKFELLRKYKFLHKYISTNYGFNFEEEEIKDEDYVFGATETNKEILMPTGHGWEEYLPKFEIQHNRKFDSMACVTFSLMNVLETIHKRKYGTEIDMSDRFTAKMSGTGRGGNSMRIVADSLRKFHGGVMQGDWPWSDDFTWDEYYKTIPQETRNKALNFFNDYEVTYEAIPPYMNSIKEALKYGPIWCAGYAWYAKNGKYITMGNPNHCFMMYDWQDGVNKMAFDSYIPYKKKLDWDSFTIAYPKLITFRSKVEESEIQKLINKGIKFVMRSDVVNGGKGQIYEIIDGILIEIGEIEKMKDEDKKNFKNNWVREQAKKGELTGVTEEFFNKLDK